ncbi:Short-chain dehydrogenase [Purpureocillium lavendulum]|uniref:Short-chain dehydrogenase n=1 Tax=Purpureocillium lavendulum TaxID=1247861 RepID=A0AB34G1Q6_9HYPO|nr:Short-chain dehydrogenase [Purpureocillium lavendulum]
MIMSNIVVASSFIIINRKALLSTTLRTRSNLAPGTTRRMATDASLADAAAALSEHYRGAASRTSAAEERSQAARASGEKSLMGGLAAPLLEQMGLSSSGPPQQQQQQQAIRLLDSACGPGVFTREVQAALGATEQGRRTLARSRFVCADSAPGLVEAARRRIEEEGWVNAEAMVADAMDTGLPADEFTHVAITLGLHLIPDPDAVLEDVKRVLQPGGMFGATTFPASNAGRFWYADMRAALASLPFAAPPLPDPMPMQVHTRGRWYDAAWAAAHLAASGFRDVRVRVVPGRHRVEGAEAWLRAFGGMLPWVMATWWPAALRRAHGEDEVRGLVRRFLEDKYGGGGWDVEWEVMSMTAVVDKAASTEA